MEGRRENIALCLTLLFCSVIMFGPCRTSGAITSEEKRQLRDKTVEMFNHAFNAYMDKAYPADELMPLSCKGRYRGSEPSRGDIDDTLGNFTLTLIDTLDTLAIIGNISRFENAVRLVIRDARFDADTVVSVFETNIRILGGLLGGHVAAVFFQNKGRGMEWYRNELLAMAKEVGDRLLPAFNTTTGIPYPRINLKHGITTRLAGATRDTCTSCAGTMILEFAALSRLTGIAVYEEKAHKAMDYLWSQRHRTSDLMGTVINLHNGDWIRRESGVGAGIDSYYEYVLKAYVLLGDDTYLARFNKHYDAVKKYIRQGPLLVDVHMHKPTSASRNFMDALLAFWPGLQVMFGDIGSAVETHEMLYQVVQRHNFLPEAFTTDFRVHWAQHPLRPEFLESTYFLYEATWDPYYLEVGKKVLNNLEEHARVDCGFAAIKDLKKGTLEDQMDSFVLAETFKYLFLLFSAKEDIPIDIDDFVFTTEAHLLPLSLSVGNYSWKAPPKTTPDIYKFDMMSVAEMTKAADDDVSFYPADGNEEEDGDDQANGAGPGTCRNYQVTVPGGFAFVHGIRAQLRDLVDNSHPKMEADRPRLKAVDFVAGNKEHMEKLHHMGIRISTMPDGRIQLLHTAADAVSQAYADAGLEFMQEMIELSKMQKQDSQHEPLYVKLMSAPFDGEKAYRAGPAQFGYNLNGNPPVTGTLAVADPFRACTPINNGQDLVGRIAILERGDCMFVEKARNLEKSGAVGGIVFDSSEGSSSDNLSLFAMSGDGTQDVAIPMVFLFHRQGQQLMANLRDHPDLEVELTCQEMEDEDDLKVQPSPPTSDSLPTVTPHQQQQQQQQDSDAATMAANLKPSIPQSSPSPSSSTPPSASDPTVVPLSKADHGFYHSEFFDPSVGQYFMQVGTNFIHLSVEVKVETADQEERPRQAVEDEALERDESERESHNRRRSLTFEPLPDGSKMITFRLRYPAPVARSSKEKPILNEIYLDVVHALQHQTNLERLPRTNDYARAIARCLESAYLQLDRIDRSALELMQDLAQKLQPRHFFPDGKETLVGENPHLRQQQQQVVMAPPMTMTDGLDATATSSSSDPGVKITVRSSEAGDYATFVEHGNAEEGARRDVVGSVGAGAIPPQQRFKSETGGLPQGPDGGFFRSSGDASETHCQTEPSSSSPSSSSPPHQEDRGDNLRTELNSDQQVPSASDSSSKTMEEGQLDQESDCHIPSDSLADSQISSSSSSSSSSSFSSSSPPLAETSTDKDVKDEL